MWVKPFPGSTLMIKTNLTGLATASLSIFPGGEVDFRAKLQVARPNRDPSVLSRPSCPSNLDINANSQQTQNRDRPVGRGMRNGWGLPARPGESRISQAARNRLRRTGYAMAERFGSAGLVFATFTLPGSTDSAVKATAEWQGYIQNRMSVFLSRRFGFNDGAVWLNRWEYQRRGALHCHLLLAVPSKSSYWANGSVSVQKVDAILRSAWGRILSDVGRKSGVRIFARATGGDWGSSPDKWQVKVLQPEKPACYLAKYCSKAEEEKNIKRAKVQSWKMTRPWSVSRAARKLLAEYTISLGCQVQPENLENVVAMIAGKLSEFAHGFQLIQNPFTLNFVGCKAYVNSALLPNALADVVAILEEHSVSTSERESTQLGAKIPIAKSHKCPDCGRSNCDSISKLKALSDREEYSVRQIVESGVNWHISKEIDPRISAAIVAYRICNEFQVKQYEQERQNPARSWVQLDMRDMLA